MEKADSKKSRNGDQTEKRRINRTGTWVSRESCGLPQRKKSIEVLVNDYSWGRHMSRSSNLRGVRPLECMTDESSTRKWHETLRGNHVCSAVPIKEKRLLRPVRDLSKDKHAKLRCRILGETRPRSVSRVVNTSGMRGWTGGGGVILRLPQKGECRRNR